MPEQELKGKPRRTLRENERRRVGRNRVLGGGVILGVLVGGIVAVRHALPTWIEPPASSKTGAIAVSRTAYGSGELLPADPVRTPKTVVSSLRTAKIMPASISVPKPTRLPLSPRTLTALGPELLPVDESDVPRRHRRRRHAPPQAAAQISPKTAPKPPASQGENADTPPATTSGETHAETTARPPDDVPGNP